MKKLVAIALVAVSLASAGAVGVGWKWGGQHKIAGWTWDDTQPPPSTQPTPNA